LGLVANFFFAPGAPGQGGARRLLDRKKAGRGSSALRCMCLRGRGGLRNPSAGKMNAKGSKALDGLSEPPLAVSGSMVTAHRLENFVPGGRVREGGGRRATRRSIWSHNSPIRSLATKRCAARGKRRRFAGLFANRRPRSHADGPPKANTGPAYNVRVNDYNRPVCRGEPPVS